MKVDKLELIVMTGVIISVISAIHTETRRLHSHFLRVKEQ